MADLELRQCVNTLTGGVPRHQAVLALEAIVGADRYIGIQSIVQGDIQAGSQ
jgi:hypothetical protein